MLILQRIPNIYITFAAWERIMRQAEMRLSFTDWLILSQA